MGQVNLPGCIPVAGMWEGLGLGPGPPGPKIRGEPDHSWEGGTVHATLGWGSSTKSTGGYGARGPWGPPWGAPWGPIFFLGWVRYSNLFLRCIMMMFVEGEEHDSVTETVQKTAVIFAG